jgi:hypothetical protein
LAIADGGVANGERNAIGIDTTSVIVGSGDILAIINNAILKNATVRSATLKTETTPPLFLYRVLAKELNWIGFRSYSIDLTVNVPGIMAIEQDSGSGSNG